MENPTYSDLRNDFQRVLEEVITDWNITKLQEFFENFKWNNIGDKRSALDHTFRDLLFKQFIENIPSIERFLQFSIDACRLELTTTTLPIVLLGDVFDAITLNHCEQIFKFVENNVSVWREELFFASCKNNLLRLCNDLLRRLSRSQNTVFCGRILLFLAKFFPFSERSGLNIVSEFNLDNLTEYDSDTNEIGESLIDHDQNVTKIDHNLYCKFWALQDFFRNPNQCYNKTEWKTFSSYASNVLSAFTSFKLDEPRNVGGNDNLIQTGDLEIQAETQYYFAKFLTNPKLLNLQLSDSNFRRSVLVQILILFQYLTSTVKFKPDAYRLLPHQLDYINETEVTIYTLLEETPPSGAIFARTVKHMLRREELWNNWKNEGCQEFKRPENQSNDSPQKSPVKRPRRFLGDILHDASKQGKFYMGNSELTKLWNICPDNLQACRGVDRNFLPSIENYLENPKDKYDQTFEWRALRLLARQSPHFFTMIQTPNKVADYLAGVRKKIHESREKIVFEQPEIKNEPTTLEVVDQEESDQFSGDDKNVHRTVSVTQEQIKEVAKAIGDDWQKLAEKLGFSQDEIKFFADEHTLALNASIVLLQLWFEDDDDASFENLAYIVEGLGMIKASDTIKQFLKQPSDNMEDVSE